MAQILKNNVSGVLGLALGASGTSMTLLDASSFPAPPGGDFYLLTLIGLNTNGQESSWEVVRVTAKASNTLTILRAQESTTAVAWPAATAVQMRLTAGSVVAPDVVATHVGSGGSAHSAATASVAGFMSGADKTKLDGVAAGAQVNAATNLGYTAAASTGSVTSSTGTSAAVPAATTLLAGLLTAADKTKLDSVATSANNYSHPANHLPSVITQDVNNRFVTDAEKTTWNAKQPPTTGLPAIRPTLLLDFANSQAVDPRVTFTRASTATRTNNKGLIETVASGVPRIDYDPVTLACKGLLIEEQRTNLLIYSEQFNNAVWTKTRATVAENVTTAPDGNLTADKLVEDTTATASHELVGAASVVSGTVYTYSIFAKPDTRSIFVATLGGVFTIAQSIAFTLTGSGTVTVLGGASTGTITALPNGWYRCTVTSIAAPSSGTCSVYTYLATSATIPGITYTGDGTSGIFVWGAQLE